MKQKEFRLVARAGSLCAFCCTGTLNAMRVFVFAKMNIYLIAILFGLTFSALAQYDPTTINGVLNNDPNNSQYNAQIQIERMQRKLREKQAGRSVVAMTPEPTRSKLRLDQLLHALDVQLVDKLSSFHLFTIVEDKDLQQVLNSAGTGAADASATIQVKLAVVNVKAAPPLANAFGLPPQTNIVFDLKDTNRLAQFKNAGINYLLETSLEDLDENHTDGAAVSRSYEYVNGQSTGWWVAEWGASRNGYSIHAGRSQSSSSWKRETANASSVQQKEQSLRVTLRSRIYNAQTGALIGSDNKTYARGRRYTASARSNNDVSMGDLYQTAAEDLANWERIVVEDNVFPIKILKVKDNEVLLNRGSDSGVKLNSYYNVWLKGEEIKDPDNGVILGYEEQKAGDVLIRELQPKFSRALISQNQGVKIGAILRLKPTL